MIRVPPLQFATLLLASVFVAQAVLRIAQLEFNILRFAVIGWPAWAVWVVAATELLGALALLQRASFKAGAVLLALVCIAFAWTYASLGVPEAAYRPVALVAAIIGLTMLRAIRPAA